MEAAFLRSPQFSRVQEAKNASNLRKAPRKRLLRRLLNAGFHMIATITGKNVQQSLRLCGNHFKAIVAITAMIWKPAYMHGNCSAIKVAMTPQRFW